MTDAELSAIRQALVGCRIGASREVISMSREEIYIIEVTEPPKKPVIIAECSGYLGSQCLAGSDWKPLYGVWYQEDRFPKNSFPHWLRRETIDGVAQVPSVVTP